MIDSVNSSISAIMAYGKKMGVHANNIANMNSEGFEKSRTLFKEGSDETVAAEIEQVAAAEFPVSESDEVQARQPESNNVDLAEEITGTMIGRRGFEANLAVVKVKDELIGTVMDLLG